MTGSPKSQFKSNKLQDTTVASQDLVPISIQNVASRLKGTFFFLPLARMCMHVCMFDRRITFLSFCGFTILPIMLVAVRERKNRRIVVLLFSSAPGVKS